MEDVEQAIQRKPKDPLILSTRALLLSYEGNWDAAFIEYQNAIDSRPNQVEPFWFNYGMLLFEKGKKILTEKYVVLILMNRKIV